MNAINTKAFENVIANVTNGRTTPAKDTLEATLAKITTAATTAGRADKREDKSSAIVALINAAGGNTKEAAKAFHIGYLIGYLNLQDNKKRSACDAAAGILTAKGFGSKAKAGKGTASRSLEQERAYASSRKAFSRILAAAGIETTEKRGTKSRKAASKGKADATPTVTAANDPKTGKGKAAAVPTALEMEAHIRTQSAALLAFINKHAKVKGVPSELRRAVVAFSKAVQAVEVTK